MTARGGIYEYGGQKMHGDGKPVESAPAQPLVPATEGILRDKLVRLAEKWESVLGYRWNNEWLQAAQAQMEACAEQLRAALAESDDRIAAASLAKAREALKTYGHHKCTCKGFPASSDEQLERDCTCGFEAALRLTAPGRETK